MASVLYNVFVPTTIIKSLYHLIVIAKPNIFYAYRTTRRQTNSWSVNSRTG